VERSDHVGAQPRLTAGRSCRTSSEVRWPGFPKSRRLFRSILLTHPRGLGLSTNNESEATTAWPMKSYFIRLLPSNRESRPPADFPLSQGYVGSSIELQKGKESLGSRNRSQSFRRCNKERYWVCLKWKKKRPFFGWFHRDSSLSACLGIGYSWTQAVVKNARHYY
jgi:hypothetical protein